MIKSATCKGVSSVALRAPSNTPLHDQCRIDYSILCRQIYALSDRRSHQMYLGENNTGPATDKDGNGAGVRVGFANGPFNVALGLGRTEYAAGDVRQANIGGHWDFGMAKLMGMYEHDKNGNLTGKGFVVGAQVPVGVGEIRASVSRYKVDSTGNPQTTKLALGYVHNLSKRTALYATLARVKNKGGAAQALAGSVTAANENSTGYEFGLRHAF